MNDPTVRHFTVVARIRAKEGCEAAVATELHKLLEPSRRDRGCVDYDLHVGREETGLFIFYENWRTQEDWEKHMQTHHLQAWREASVGLVEDIEIVPLEKIE